MVSKWCEMDFATSHSKSPCDQTVSLFSTMARVSGAPRDGEVSALKSTARTQHLCLSPLDNIKSYYIQYRFPFKPPGENTSIMKNGSNTVKSHGWGFKRPGDKLLETFMTRVNTQVAKPNPSDRSPTGRMKNCAGNPAAERAQYWMLLLACIAAGA